MKILAVFKEEGPARQIVESEVEQFLLNVFKLYKKQVLQAHSQFKETGRFKQKFYEQLDSFVSMTKFKTEKSKSA